MLGVDLDLVGFPAATRYTRSPLAFSDVSVKPSFFRTTPAKKPRTECCCHPVAFMIAAIVAPLDCLSSPRTVSCLVPPRVKPEATFPFFAGFFARLAGATFGLLGVLRCDIFEILSVATARAPSPPKPHSDGIASGAGSETRPKGPHQHDDTDALFAAEVQSFLQGISALIGTAFQGLKLRSPLLSVSDFGSSSPLWAMSGSTEYSRSFRALARRCRVSESENFRFWAALAELGLLGHGLLGTPVSSHVHVFHTSLQTV